MSDSSFASAPRPNTTFSFFPSSLLLCLFLPVLAAVAFYQLHRFDPSPFPLHELAGPPLTAPLLNDHVLRGAEFVGAGRLNAPEDIAYHRESGLIYTGCADGWIKRVKVVESSADSVVEDWFNTGGRPLGLAIGRHGEIIVADAYKGLLNISKDGSTAKVLASEAEGLKLKLTDAADVAEDGVIYFTDASYKYSLGDYILDFMEGKPHGRLLSYDPATRDTTVLLNDLYFANGVVVAPDQNHVIFCETVLRRCRKYYIQGEKKGHVEEFLERLPGIPDNIRYDGQGHYWIALFSSVTNSLDLLMRYPFLRKIAAIMAKHGLHLPMENNAGALQVDLEGKTVAHYYDPGLSHISTGIKIGKHLYFGSIHYPYIIRVNLDQHSPRSPL